MACSEPHGFLVKLCRQAFGNYVILLVLCTWEAFLAWKSALTHNEWQTWKKFKVHRKVNHWQGKYIFQTKNMSSRANHWMHWMQMSGKSWMWQAEDKQHCQSKQVRKAWEKRGQGECMIQLCTCIFSSLVSERSFRREAIRLYRLTNEKLS